MEMLLSDWLQVTEKDRILEKVWGFNSEVEYNNLEVYISFLRKNLLLSALKHKLKQCVELVTIWRKIMIKSLKRKFIFSAFIIMTIVMAIILGLVNFFMYSQTIKRTENMLSFLVNNDFSNRSEEHKNINNNSGQFKLFPSFDYKDNLNTFVVTIDNDGNISEYSDRLHTSFTQEEKYELSNKIINENSEKGIYDEFYYLLNKKENKTILAVTDISQQQAMLKQLLIISFIIYIVSICVVILIALFLSNWVIRPAKTAIQKQKQFIADASHELKTPLTIIKSNADVLESELGENKWVGYIQSESLRMSELVNDMLYLAKYDDNKFDIYEFDLSSAVTQASLPFESIAFEKEVKFDTYITPGINYTGDKKAMKQLITILLDNALKNTEKNGKVEINLTTNKKNILIKVSNTGVPIPKDDLEKIFDRFYRYDNARSRKNGGFGLGLSIANAIVTKSGGTINVRSKNGINLFLVKL